MIVAALLSTADFEALDKGVEIFNWDEKKARSGKRVGNKVRGSGVAVSSYSAGSTPKGRYARSDWKWCSVVQSDQ